MRMSPTPSKRFLPGSGCCQKHPLYKRNHVQVNDDICAILDKDSEFPDCIDREDQTFTTGKLYFWNVNDPEQEALFSVTSVSQFVLMGREVVYARGDNLMARKDDKSERVLVEKLPSAYVKKMLISKEQDRLYLIFRENSLVTYELPEGKEVNRVPAPGLLRSVQLYGGHIIGINKDNHLARHVNILMTWRTSLHRPSKGPYQRARRLSTFGDRTYL